MSMTPGSISLAVNQLWQAMLKLIWPVFGVLFSVLALLFLLAFQSGIGATILSGFTVLNDQNKDAPAYEPAWQKMFQADLTEIQTLAKQSSKLNLDLLRNMAQTLDSVQQTGKSNGSPRIPVLNVQAFQDDLLTRVDQNIKIADVSVPIQFLIRPIQTLWPLRQKLLNVTITTEQVGGGKKEIKRAVAMRSDGLMWTFSESELPMLTIPLTIPPSSPWPRTRVPLTRASTADAGMAGLLRGLALKMALFDGTTPVGPNEFKGRLSNLDGLGLLLAYQNSPTNARSGEPSDREQIAKKAASAFHRAAELTNEPDHHFNWLLADLLYQIERRDLLEQAPYQQCAIEVSDTVPVSVTFEGSMGTRQFTRQVTLPDIEFNTSGFKAFRQVDGVSANQLAAFNMVSAELLGKILEKFNKDKPAGSEEPSFSPLSQQVALLAGTQIGEVAITKFETQRVNDQRLDRIKNFERLYRKLNELRSRFDGVASDNGVLLANTSDGTKVAESGFENLELALAVWRGVTLACAENKERANRAIEQAITQIGSNPQMAETRNLLLLVAARLNGDESALGTLIEAKSLAAVAYRVRGTVRLEQTPANFLGAEQDFSVAMQVQESERPLALRNFMFLDQVANKVLDPSADQAKIKCVRSKAVTAALELGEWLRSGQATGLLTQVFQSRMLGRVEAFLKASQAEALKGLDASTSEDRLDLFLETLSTTGKDTLDPKAPLCFQ
jgi:hypothetical protein